MKQSRLDVRPPLEQISESMEELGDIAVTSLPVITLREDITSKFLIPLAEMLELHLKTLVEEFTTITKFGLQP
jgi:hypothetical protein